MNQEEPIQKQLIGKIIKSAKIVGHSKGCDSENVLILVMTDGTRFEITGGYGGYTGNSCDEYVETIEVEITALQAIEEKKQAYFKNQ